MQRRLKPISSASIVASNHDSCLLFTAELSKSFSELNQVEYIKYVILFAYTKLDKDLILTTRVCKIHFSNVRIKNKICFFQIHEKMIFLHIIIEILSRRQSYRFQKFYEIENHTNFLVAKRGIKNKNHEVFLYYVKFNLYFLI